MLSHFYDVCVHIYHKFYVKFRVADNGSLLLSVAVICLIIQGIENMGSRMKNLRTFAGLFMLVHVDAALAARAGQSSNGLDKNEQHKTLRDACSPQFLPSGEPVQNPSCFMKPEEQPQYQGQRGAAPLKAQ
jgi:hypothetical protein